MPTRISIELAHHRVDSRSIEGAACRRIAGEIKLILHPPHVLIEVIGADLIHDGVGVGEEELDVFRIFLLHHVIVEPNPTFENEYERILRLELSREKMVRLPVSFRNDELCAILEHVKFAEFPDSEPNI